MDTRREFFKKAALLSGGAGLFSTLPSSVQRALAIDPAPGSTYLDAEHIVVLMQENRSFDHSYGCLQGVRGFNDPRTITLPNKNKVWLQSNDVGDTYLPFRLNMRETRSTWLGSLPHSWADQVDARNNGKYDKWLLAKASGHKGFERVPLTLGYYNREDIPFYYSLADAFTVCDQNFCSSLTGTTPNRLYLWTGTLRAPQSANAQANVSNSDVGYEKEINWKTFPERLEENDISWKIYQNELSIESGLTSEEDDWLANFTDNPIEWFSQYQVRFSPTHQAYLRKMAAIVPGEIKQLEEKLSKAVAGSEEADKTAKEIKSKQALLKRIEDRHKWSKENFEKLTQKQKNLHNKAFSTNSGDPNYRRLDTLRYKDGDTERDMQMPAGDVLHQFREDVNTGRLPAISWVIGSSNFSDHPGSPWYGAWYVSEVLDILTKNPEVWKKTIFILCYDENDGYFDHVPPFVPPHPKKPDTGRVSTGIDTSSDYVELAQDLKRTKPESARESPIGLSYRVPLVIASPWSRGGAVCSQVFDHTSILQLMEKFLQHKTGKKIEESNISSWRRTVCGDLSSVFKPYRGEKINLPEPLARESFYESIHKLQFKRDPFGYKKLSAGEISQVNRGEKLDVSPRQEKGTRVACPLPYELYSVGRLIDNGSSFQIDFAAGNGLFGKQSAGCPYMVYARQKDDVEVRNYAVMAGDKLSDTWKLDEFEAGVYHLEVYGPNGFSRIFRGNKNDPKISVTLDYERASRGVKKPTGNIILQITTEASYQIDIRDNAYGKGVLQKQAAKSSGSNSLKILLDCSKSFGWYDFSVLVKGHGHFEQRFTGHVETGDWSRTDPAMAGE